MVWTQKVNLKGPQGDPGTPGTPGADGEEVSLQVAGDYIQWRLGSGAWANLIALDELKGEDGAGIEIAGSVPTYGDLPDDLGVEDAGDGYLVQADGKLYIWSGTEFPANGSGVEFRGPQGPAGADGADGADGQDGAPGAAGKSVELRVFGGNVEWRQGTDGAWNTLVPLSTITGPQGNPGADGTDGVDGLRGTQWFSGAGSPGTVAGSAPGDFYLDESTGVVWVLE